MALESIDMIPGFAFWREGCHTFGKQVFTVLDLANKDWKYDDLVRFIVSLPRMRGDVSSPGWEEGFCSQCLKRAIERSPEAASVVRYFLMDFPDRGCTAQAMLIDAFLGFVAAVDEASVISQK